MKTTGLIKLLTLSLLVCSLTSCSHGRVKNPRDWDKKDRGIAAGGAGGALIGSMVGNQSGNAAAGAVIGGVAGATAGGVIGNEFDKQDKRR